MGPRELVRRVTAHSPSYFLGRFQTVRRTVSLLTAAKDRLSGKKLAVDNDDVESPFRDVDVPNAVAEIARDSFAPGFVLPADMVKEIALFASTEPCFESHIQGDFHYGDIERGKFKNGTPTATAHIRRPLECPAVARLNDDPVLNSVVHGYLGFLPRSRDVRLYWSFASDHTADTRRQLYQTIDYHFDVHDYNFCYAHFYITDTDRHSGAHCLVRGSHKKKPVSWLLGSTRKTDAEIAGYYDPKDILVLEAPAGYGFVEDTSCYHKAIAPVASDRLMLQVRYH